MWDVATPPRGRPKGDGPEWGEHSGGGCGVTTRRTTGPPSSPTPHARGIHSHPLTSGVEPG